MIEVRLIHGVFCHNKCVYNPQEGSGWHSATWPGCRLVNCRLDAYWLSAYRKDTFSSPWAARPTYTSSWTTVGGTSMSIVNPIETETSPKMETDRGLFVFGCSLFTLFSVSTLVLEPSEKTTTSPPFCFRSTSIESSNRNQWIYQIKHGRKLISLWYLFL